MYAIIKTGGKQYRVQQGDEFRVDMLLRLRSWSRARLTRSLSISTKQRRITDAKTVTDSHTHW